MVERPLDVPDAGLAFAIGALAGIGVALLLRGDRDDAAAIVRDLRLHGVRARCVSRRRSRELRELVELARSLPDEDWS